MKNLELRIMRRDSKFSILNSQFLIGSIVFALITFIVQISRAEGELRFRFKPGDKYLLLFNTEQKSTQLVTARPDANQGSAKTAAEVNKGTDGQAAPGAGQVAETVQQQVRLKSDLDIEEVDDNGVAWARYTYRQVAFKAKWSTNDIQFDSESGQTRVPTEVLPFYLVLGESLFLKITPQGRIAQINGLPALVSSAKARAPNITGKNLLTGAIEGMFSETTLRRIVEDQLAIFPGPNDVCRDPCVRAADADYGQRVTRWTRTERIVEEPPKTVYWSFWLREIRGGIASVDVNIIIIPDANFEQTIGGGIKVRRLTSGKGFGNIEIEEATGRIINEQVTKDMLEEVKVSSEGPVLRLPSPPSPKSSSIVTTFQMIKREYK